MSDALTRQEYPALLTSLQPSQAVTILGDRIKRIGKVNIEIADWLQERRKVEELYIQGLKKLTHKQPPDSQSELGIFTTPWQKIISATESIALSHQTFVTRIEKDIEEPLRSFASHNRDMTALVTMQLNLVQAAKELSEAQERSDKLSKKSGKSNSLKLDGATQRLENCTQQWDSQAPFVFEKLQAVDEARLNHLRDFLTQYQTHEADQIERNRVNAETTLNSMLEVDTTVEILNFATNATRGKPRLENRPRLGSSSGSTSQPPRQGSSSGSTTLPRQGSSSGSAAFAPVPLAPSTSVDDGPIPPPSRKESSSEHKGGLKRLGTMLGRRRKSVQGQSSKGFAPLSRNSSSRDGGPSLSPRHSSHNLQETLSRDIPMSSVAESPTTPTALRRPTEVERSQSTDMPNGNVNGPNHVADTLTTIPTTSTAGAASVDLSDVKPPPGPPPAHLNSNAVVTGQRDSEGFTVPAAVNDPITQAQLDAAEENDQQQFKLNIRNEPIQDRDTDAQAALSNVANTLRSSSAVTPTRKAGTVRGRRDVRNTMYIPAPEPVDIRSSENSVPSSTTVPPGIAKPATLTPLPTGESNASDAPDAQSIRSARSLTNSAAVKHPEMHKPGLNSSIIETVSVSIENGELKTGAVIGELALVFGHVDSDPLASSGVETIRLDNFPVLEAIAPNHAFINEVSPERPGEYKVTLSSLAKTSVAFRYKVHIDETNLMLYTPIILKPAWRPQGDKLGMVIEYHMNPAFQVPSITLNNLILIATYQNARAAGCQTKPTGTHLKEKSLIYWRLGDVTLDSTVQRVIARLIGAEGAEPQAGIIEARWEYQGTSMGSTLGISRLEAADKGKEKEEVDPFADESLAATSPGGSWVEIESVRKVVSGKYDARQVTSNAEGNAEV